MGLEDHISDAYLKCVHVLYSAFSLITGPSLDRTSRRTLLALDREVDILETRIRQLEAAMELMKLRKEAAESLRNSLRARRANQARSRDKHDVPTEVRLLSSTLCKKKAADQLAPLSQKTT